MYAYFLIIFFRLLLIWERKGNFKTNWFLNVTN